MWQLVSRRHANASRNYVKYLISNDSCCLGNLYIEWGNAKFKDFECLDELRLFHPKVYPQLWFESIRYLFLGSAASSGFPVSGWELSLYPLQPGDGDIKTYDLIDPEAFDPSSMTLLREIDHPTETHFLEAYNIRTNRTKQIHFQHRFPPDDHNWNIDSISITPHIIFVRVAIDKGNDQTVKETIELKNDIQ